jgi:hypothetical protein
VRAILALFLIACGSDSGQFPPGTAPLLPGGSGGTQNRPDAGPAPDAGDAGTVVIPADAGPGIPGDGGMTGGMSAGITGVVCSVTNIHTLTPCNPVTASSLTVTVLGTSARAQVGADGRFALPAAPGLTQITLVTSTDDPSFFGSAVVANAGAGGTAVVTIPVMRQTDAIDLGVAAGVPIVHGSGVLVVHTVSGATLAPIGGVIPYYDTTGTGQLLPSAPTGADGLAIFFNLSGMVTITIRTSGGAPSGFSATVVPDTLTFVSAPV